MKPLLLFIAATLLVAPDAGFAQDKKVRLCGAQSGIHVSGAASGGEAHLSGATTPGKAAPAPKEAKQKKPGDTRIQPTVTRQIDDEHPAPGEVRKPRQPVPATVEEPRAPSPPRAPGLPGTK